MAAAILSFSFSMAVILGTMGVMDGFEFALKKGLNQANGDMIITKSRSFFKDDDRIISEVQNNSDLQVSAAIQTQGFVVQEDSSKGVLIFAIEPNTFNIINNLTLSISKGEIVIGTELAKHFAVKAGDSLTVAFAGGDSSFNELAKLISFKVVNIVDHGLYEKNIRTVYLHKKDVEQILGLSDKSNQLFLKFKNSSIEKIKYFVSDFNYSYGPIYRAFPYWHEFAPLLEAVKVEKVTLTVILQIVVLVAIFNVLALIIFLRRKRAPEIFILQALGMSRPEMTRSWMGLILLMWVVACFFFEFFRNGPKFFIKTCLVFATSRSSLWA